jgi:hypothetical protein
MPKEFRCPLCSKLYDSSGVLRKHLRKFPAHKSAEAKNSGSFPASKAVDLFLGVNETHQRARLRELVKQITIEEVQDIFLPRVSKCVSLDNFAVEKSRGSVRKDQASVVKLSTELEQCIEKLTKWQINIFY